MLARLQSLRFTCLFVLLLLTIFNFGCGGNATSSSNTPPNNPTPNPGGGGTSPSGAEISIVGSVNQQGLVNGDLIGYTVDTKTGFLHQAYDIPYPSNAPYAVAINAAGNLLAVHDTAGITMFSIAPSTGTLTQVDRQTAAGAGVSTNIQFHPNGRFLYAGIGTGITAFAVDGAGHLTPVAGSPFTGAPSNDFGQCIELTIDPSGNFIFIGCRHFTGPFRIDQNTGALLNSVSVPTVVSMPTFDRTGRLAFAGTFTTRLEMQSWAFDPNTGNMTFIGTAPINGIDSVFHIAATHDNSFVYISSSNELFGFALSPSGMLTPLNGGNRFDLPSGKTASFEVVISVAVDMTDRFLYVTSQRGISAFTIDHKTGNLNAVGPAFLPPDTPEGIVFSQH